ncbi:MAG: hypothetical protein WEE89_13960 [Gemmatimonadota bacterium]
MDPAVARSNVPVTWSLGAARFTFAEDAALGVVLHRVGSPGALLADGTAVIANSGQGQLVFLGHDGSVLRAAGRLGKGPGEFSNAVRVFNNGNEIATWDISQRRVSYWSADGRLKGDQHVQTTYQPTLTGMLDPGSPLIRPRRPPVVQPIVYISYSNPGRSQINIGKLVPEQSDLVKWTYPNGSGTNVVMASCFPALLDAAVDGRIVLIDNAAGTMILVDRAGRSSIIFERQHSQMVTPDMISRVKKSLASFPAPAPAETMTAVLKRLGVEGSRLPTTWDRIIPDQTGRVWLRRAQCQLRPPIRTWDVVDLSGRWVAIASIPDIEVLAAREMRLLGLVRDSLGIEHVALYEVIARGNVN